MRLSFSGSPEVTAPRAVVWQRLLDAEFVAASAPGVERVERVGDNRFNVISAVGIGALKLHFTLAVELLELTPPEHVVMRAHGNAPGTTVDVAAIIDLVEAGPGRTTMNWRSRTSTRWNGCARRTRTANSPNTAIVSTDGCSPPIASMRQR